MFEKSRQEFNFPNGFTFYMQENKLDLIKMSVLGGTELFWLSSVFTQLNLMNQGRESNCVV